ncbi:putative sulfatase [Haloactinopolyspora alba]|uniref:Putative sulfatase n=1 Tax=Haloactinopolyspora alba TaxID=648780 RepID=A0A2P8E2A1_9ACTN|nr:sulfatase-like hydrolase/transferase [Haloactinopolyspora alba]PSL03610.1 putative sulfatase [Haloactinopolyspora alba]
MVRQRPPNIVLAVVDDLGIGDLGTYGGELIRTRTVDRLARTGVTCSAMYAAAATDTPSRAGIVTGRFGARFGLPASLRPGATAGLPTGVPTVASGLQAAGYATGLFGQWRLGSGRGQHPLDMGFDRFAGTLYGSDVSPLGWYEDRAEVEAGIDIGSTTRRITSSAQDFLHGLGSRRQRENPFLMVLSYLVPHAPFRVDPEYARSSRAGSYGDVVEAVDDQLGELLREIRRRQGRREDTLVIFTSDNGPRYEGSNHGLRGRKPEVMDGAMLVPFVAAWLRGGRGRTDGTPRSLLDLAPTLWSVAGATPPGDVDGADMSALFDGGTPARGPVYLYYNEWLNAVRSERWKLHVAYGNDARAYMPALYDVARDPRESVNIAELFPDVVADLTTQLEETRADVTAGVTSGAAGGTT